MGKFLGGLVGIIAVVAIVVLGFKFGGLGFGNGSGEGDGQATGPQQEEQETTVAEQEDESSIITIKVDESTIYIDDEKCADIDELKSRISEVESKGNEKDYVYEHEYAIKETADEVERALRSLEDTLQIKVEYNE